MNEDYFGDIAELDSADEEEEDVANDLTFGDTSDIIAGDPDSDVLWKPGHDAVAEQIEREKEAMLRRESMPQGAQKTASSVRADDVGAAQAQPQHAARERVVLQQHPQQRPQQQQNHHQQQLCEQQNLQLLLQQQQQQQQQQQKDLQARHERENQTHAQHKEVLGNHASQQSVLMPERHLQYQNPQIPHPFMSSGVSHPVSAEGLNAMHRQQLAILQQLQQRQQLLFAEQQRLLLMLQLPRPPEEATQLREKQRALAQQDQQLRQMHEHQVRFMQHQLHQQHQLLQQQQSYGNLRHVAHSSQNGPREPSRPGGVHDSPHSQSMPGRPVIHGALGAVGVPKPAGDASGPRSENKLWAEDYTQQLPSASAGNAGVPKTNPPLPKTALTLEDVERDLLSSAKSSQNHPQHGDAPGRTELARGSVTDSHSVPSTGKPKGAVTVSSSQPTRRRLESMTDRDMEIVLRMHLRQLETAVPYMHDFYSYAVNEKQTLGYEDTYESLAKVVVSMYGLSGRPHIWAKSGPKGARPRISSSGQTESDDGASVSTSTHTQENLNTLATALGTLQVWNPKAPRKLVDFGGVSRAAGSTVGDGGRRKPGSGGDALMDGKLLREDERVVVRASVEDGYDIMGAIHDVARRKSNAPVDPLVKSLFAVLRLPASPSAADRNSEDAFFVRMCGFSKGRTFVARAFMLFRPIQKKRVTLCVMRNLHHLVRAESSAPSVVKEGSFWWTFTNFIGDAALDPEWVVDVVRNFNLSHKDQPDSVIYSVSSSSGSSLLCIAMQRILANKSCDVYDEGRLTHVNECMGCLCESVSAVLREVFENTRSSDLVWQVVAMLDALAPETQRTLLRTTLKLLLDAGHAPPPPAS